MDKQSYKRILADEMAKTSELRDKINQIKSLIENNSNDMELGKKIRTMYWDNKKNNNSDTADGMIIQDKEVALMSAVKPKTIPPKPSVNGKITNHKKTSIFAKIIKMIFGKNKEEDKLNKRHKRYYGKSRRYNKNFKYNKFKSNNKKSYTRNSRQKNN